MLQSTTPFYLKCYFCARTPSSFTVLLCNHVYCGQCLPNNMQKSQKFNIIKCKCHAITYINNNDQVLDSQTTLPNSLIVNQNNNSTKFIDEFSPLKLKNRNLYENYENLDAFESVRKIQTNPSNQNQESYLLENSQKFYPHYQDEAENAQIEQKLSKQYKISKNNKITLNITKINESFQQKPHKNIQNYENYLQLFTKQSQKHNKPTHNETFSFSTIKQSPLQHNNYASIAFKSELQFLNILFKKSLEQISGEFSHLLMKLSKNFTILQNQLKNLYLQKIITSETIQNLSISTLIKKRYQNKIGNYLKFINNQIVRFRMHSTNPQKQKDKAFTSNKPSMFKFVDEIQSKSTPKNKQASKTSLNTQKIKNHQKQKTTHNLIDLKYPRHTYNGIGQKNDKLDTQNDRKFETFTAVYSEHNPLKNIQPKRLKTQNIHTAIRSVRNGHFNDRLTYTSNHNNNENNNSNNKKPQSTYPYKSKIKQTNPKLSSSTSITQIYCNKHLQKRQIQARNYLSYIEKLCHENRMKNHKQLFKRVKTKNYHEKNIILGIDLKRK